MKNLSEKNQRKQIADFYKELWTYTGQLPWLVPVLFMIPCICFFCIPVSMARDKLLILGAILLCNLPMTMLSPYLETNYKAQPKIQKQEIYRVLQYLPVSGKQIRMFLTERIWNFMWKFSLTAVSLQTISSCLLHAFTVWNLLIVWLMTLVLPMGIGILMIYERTKEKK